MAKRYIDLTYEIRDGMPTWPGAPPTGFVYYRQYHPETGELLEKFRAYQFITDLHTGTHAEAPFAVRGHKLEDVTVDRVPLEKLIGEALVVSIPKEELQEITREDLLEFQQEIRNVRRVLLNTGWQKYWGTWKFFKKCPALMPDAAKFLADQEILLLALDTPTMHPTNWEADIASHTAILEKGVALIENIANLGQIRKAHTYFIGLPLRIVGQGAAPMRAVAIEEE